MKKYTNESGQVGIIVSYGFGAGFSTWADDDEQFFSMDKGLVDLCLKKASSEEAEAYIKSIKGDNYYIYMGGWEDCEVEWVDKGTKFTIHEYDGSESLRMIDDLSTTA